MNQTTTNDKYSLAERLKRVKKTRWIRFSIVALLYIGWTIWLNNYYCSACCYLSTSISPNIFRGGGGKPVKIRSFER